MSKPITAMDARAGQRNQAAYGIAIVQPHLVVTDIFDVHVGKTAQRERWVREGQVA